MNLLKVALAAVALLMTSLPLMARVEQVAEKDKLTVTYYSATNSIVRIETTVKTGDEAYKTTITDADGNQLGEIIHTVLKSRTDKDSFTYLYTRNERYDAAKNYVDTSYSIFVIDPKGILVNIIQGRRLDDLLGIDVHGVGDAKRGYGAITAGVDSGLVLN